MPNELDVSLLDGVISKTIQAVELSKEQIFEIAENARLEKKTLEHEIADVRKAINVEIDQVDKLEIKYRQTRSRLAQVSRNFNQYTEDDIRVAYEEANQYQIDLSITREREANLRSRRDELERRLRNIDATVIKAEGLITQMGVVMGYLSGDLSKIELALETAKQHQLMGIRVIQAQEEERKRVSREIHDGPAQSMANVVLRTEIVEKMLAGNHVEEAKTELQDLKEIVRSSLADVRRIIFDLRPMALDDLGLVPTVQKYIQKFEERTSLTIDLVVFGKEMELESSFKAALFRLVQECLNNIAKHSHARLVQVKLEFQPDMVFIVVKDDGVGFVLNEVKRKGNSFGLMGMNERTQLLQGKMEIVSAPKQGTRVIFQIPMKT
ncbi:sensor histidine kinase [Brevibacillus ginsengisoli]|uniref:sensor histidine kinase n=1 Tax=Brevibacillus ginsengisoli TaxID=363854 RepID=UPI003CE7F6FB